jgi:hypothetical protein
VQRLGRTSTAVMALLGALLMLIGSAPSVQAAGPPSPGSGTCDVTVDPTCTVGVGGGGGGGSSGGGDGGGTTTGCQNTDPFNGGCDPCPTNDTTVGYGSKPPQVSQVCADYLQAGYCRAILGDMLGGLGWPAPNQLTVQQIDVVNQNLAGDGCPPLVTPASLAQQAFNSIHFPRPSGDRSPSQDQLYAGYPFTYVGLWTYFWTDPSTWHTLSATAAAAGLSATVSAEPVALIYDPGDGRSAATCDGPGRPWRDSDGNSAPSGGACGYQYRDVTSGPITSTQTIVWKITWTGTGNTGGQFPQLSTSTSGQLQVMQIQTMVTR